MHALGGTRVSCDQHLVVDRRTMDASVTSGCGLGIRLPRTRPRAPVVQRVWPLGCEEGAIQHNSIFETSSPTASATPSRPPDSNGWYNHASRSRSAAAPSPGSPRARRRRATQVPTRPVRPSAEPAPTTPARRRASRSSPFDYAASPPLLSASSEPADSVIALQWAMSDLAPTTIRILRSPGYGRQRTTVVYTGGGASYRDEKVRNGVKYQYTLIATDQAGNTTTRTLWVVPGPRLVAPKFGALLSAPPLMQWTPVRKAAYYNVQLYRDGRKILSSWPANASIQLRANWRFEGRRYRLKPGHYRWYVWPGFGRRRAAKYGREVGNSTFVVVRGAEARDPLRA